MKFAIEIHNWLGQPPKAYLTKSSGPSGVEQWDSPSRSPSMATNLRDPYSSNYDLIHPYPDCFEKI